MAHPAKVKILAMGRRWGKTVLGGCVSLSAASQGASVAWIVPAYPNGRSLWRWAENSTAEVRVAGEAKSNKTERVIEFANGGLFGIYSSDAEDSIRGNAFHLVIIDEAARVAETTWTEVIQPTLADYDGDAILISTPKGLNWFYNEFQRGQADGIHQVSFQAPSCDNPNPRIKAAYEKAKALPELTFMQEWDAKFVSMEGTVFRRVQEACTAKEIDAPLPGHQYIAGVDVAAAQDYTVVSVLDVADKALVYMDRFNRVDYNVLEDRLHAIYKRFGLTAMIVEANSIGQGVIDHLANRGMSIIPFTTTNVTKQAIVTKLQGAFEHGEIHIIPNTFLVGELLSFESKRNASGSFSYSAPEGMHDDCVMSLAIGWYGMDQGRGASLVAFAG